MRTALLLAPLCLAAQPLIDSIAGVGPNQRDLVDGLPATEAVLGEVHPIAIDPNGDLLIGAQRIVVRVGRDGVAHAVAGTGTMGNDGHAGARVPAEYAPVGFLRGLAVTPDGSIYFSDIQSVRRIGADGFATTILARSHGYLTPRGVAVDAAGNVFVAALGHIPSQRFTGMIVRITPQGGISELPLNLALGQPEGLTIGPDGALYVAEYRGDRILKITGNHAVVLADKEHGLSGPSGVAVSGDGTLYVADTFNRRIRVIAPDGTASTLEGPRLAAPAQVALDAGGALYVTEYDGHRVWRHAGGEWTVVAGNGRRVEAPREAGDGGPSRLALLERPEGIAYCAGVVYVADTGLGLIRKITPDDWVDSIAGGFRLPTAVACNAAGVVAVAERGTPRVSRVEADGRITVVATENLGEPRAIAIDDAGTLFVLDWRRSRVLRIDAAGRRTVLWSGVVGVDYPIKLALDREGRPHFILLRDPGNDRRVFRIEPDGSLAHVAGSGVCTAPEIRDGTPARAADFCDLFGLAFDEQGTLYVSDQYAVYSIGAEGTRRAAGRRFEPNEVGPIPLGDGAPATAANLGGASAIAVGEIGLYAIQSNRVRRVPF